MRRLLRSGPRWPSQAPLTGRPAALLANDSAASTRAPRAYPAHSLMPTSTLEKNNLLYARWRETDNFPDMCCFPRPHLPPVWVFPLGQGWRRKGQPPQRTPCPATSRLGGRSAGRRVWSPRLQPTLALLTTQRVTLGKSCPLPGPQSPQLHNGELAHSGACPLWVLRGVRGHSGWEGTMGTAE